ncbi:hypothetical protein FHW69_002804 [Luteibacter sp. Sphag1AF]|uniref:hypothetical protein n=1 Tax=Luteibacter sp. Sphag1AF TaxID=2587031 RepID=UPI0016165F6E|nr:hypothetical protein [Luteibacter sp. Sphag1AF]MBB3228169.1 hypothetical protein [Luteibacter sp. Sphag1AF]
MISWNHCFEDPWESAWGACHRVAWLNACSVREAVEAMVGRRVALADLREALFTGNGRWWTETSLQSSDDAQAAFSTMRARFGRDGPVSQWLRAVAPLLAREPRYCPRCLRSGFHSVIHQLAGLDRCPWHGSPLRMTCDFCHSPFADLRQVAVGGLACQHCGVSVVPESWPLHISTRTRRRRVAIENEVISWTRAAITDYPAPSGWGINPVGVHEKRGLMPRSWSAVLLPMLASHTPFPLNGRLLCPSPAQLQRIDGTRLGPARKRPNWLDVDQAFEDVSGEVKQYLGPHMHCYEGARFMLSSIHVTEDTLPWEGDLCVMAWAYFIWRTRCRYMVNESKKLTRYSDALVTEFVPDMLRRDLLSSFHHGLQILVMSRSMLARGILPPDRGLVTLWDPWTRMMDSPASHGFAYGPADPADINDCDQGRVAARWEHPMATLRRRQKQERAGNDPAVLGVYRPATRGSDGMRGIGPHRWLYDPPDEQAVTDEMDYLRRWKPSG